MRKNSAFEIAPSPLHCDIVVQNAWSLPANRAFSSDVTTVMVHVSKGYAVAMRWRSSGG